MLLVSIGLENGVVHCHYFGLLVSRWWEAPQLSNEKVQWQNSMQYASITYNRPPQAEQGVSHFMWGSLNSRPSGGVVKSSCRISLEVYIAQFYRRLITDWVTEISKTAKKTCSALRQCVKLTSVLSSKPLIFDFRQQTSYNIHRPYKYHAKLRHILRPYKFLEIHDTHNCTVTVSTVAQQAEVIFSRSCCYTVWSAIGSSLFSVCLSVRLSVCLSVCNAALRVGVEG